MIHWDLELTSTQNNEPGPLNHVLKVALTVVFSEHTDSPLARFLFG